MSDVLEEARALDARVRGAAINLNYAETYRALFRASVRSLRVQFHVSRAAPRLLAALCDELAALREYYAASEAARERGALVETRPTTAVRGSPGCGPVVERLVAARAAVEKLRGAE